MKQSDKITIRDYIAYTLGSGNYINPVEVGKIIREKKIENDMKTIAEWNVAIGLINEQVCPRCGLPMHLGNCLKEIENE